MRFLGIILRVLGDLRFLYGVLKPKERGYGFLIRLSSFLLYRNSNRMRGLEEIEISGHSGRGDYE
jgi:hypothetical protein